MRPISAELQHDVRRELIGCIFPAPEYGDIENIEYRMPKLVRHGKKQLPDDRVARRDPRRGRLLRHIFLYLLQIFVAEAYRRPRLFAQIPRVRNAIASDHFYGQIAGKAERTESFVQGLKHLALFDWLVDFLVLGVLGRLVCNVNRPLLRFVHTDLLTRRGAACADNIKLVARAEDNDTRP